jgi:hypothetical protein
MAMLQLIDGPARKVLYVFDRDTDLLQKAHKNTYFQAYIIQCIVSYKHGDFEWIDTDIVGA